MSVYTGVTERNGDFIVKITRNGKLYRLGAWCSEQEASQAYLVASDLLDINPTLDRECLLLLVLKGL